MPATAFWTARNIAMPGLLAFFVAVLIAMGCGPVSAQTFPERPDGPVLDAANIIGAPQEALLDRRLRDYSRKTGRSVIVATIPTVDGAPIDVYARDLAEEWQISGAQTEEGVLMLVAHDDRELWITTARGVQGTLTDISTGRIIRGTIVPAFKRGDYAGGIASGVEQIIERLDMDPAQAAAIAEAEAAAARQGPQENGGFPISAIFWFLLLLFFFILPMLGGGKRKRYRRGRRGGFGAGVVGDIILWEAGKAVARGLTDSDSGFGRRFWRRRLWRRRWRFWRLRRRRRRLQRRRCRRRLVNGIS